jgi:transitional endoplasmic reticulum ATPase
LQHTLARHERALILFDEIEDIFEDDHFGLTGKAGFQKGWFNRQLEGNPVPAVWITNDVEMMDQAYIRRFDVVVELGVPPRRVREQIVRQHLGSLPVSDQWINATSQNEDLAPAVVARSAKVIEVVGGNQGETEKNLGVLLRETMGAMGLNNRISTAKESLIPYSLDFLNADVDLHELVEGLRRHRSARICLYGISGSGKSAFGRHLAKELDMPLHVRRASDLLGPYVGETEQALARMFRDAADDGAVLLLDEADSFFRERQAADHRWEVSQVNELLTQMEDFEGLFVCSTNLMEVFDRASLRRFDLKIKFDYLRPEQTWRLFQKVIQSQGRGRSDDRLQHQLALYSNLTPGDFATVVRRNRLSAGPLTPQTLLGLLVREVRTKDQGRSKPIGFTAKI